MFETSLSQSFFFSFLARVENMMFQKYVTILKPGTVAQSYNPRDSEAGVGRL